VVWRRKYGMSVPTTDWLLGAKGQSGPAPLAPLVSALLGPEALRRRGLFQPAYVEQLRAGNDQPFETRRRRIGEKLWALVMLEAWLRRFIDARGQAP
jgi:asparagine synthase (glutamine-hydrolysing)